MKQIVRFVTVSLFLHLHFHFSFCQAPGIGKKITLSPLEDVALNSCILTNNSIAVVGVDSFVRASYFDLKENTVSGRPFIAVYDSSGKAQWRKHFPGHVGGIYTATPAKGGNLIAAGLQYRHRFDYDTSRLILTKFTANGDIVFDKRIELNSFSLRKLIECGNGDLIVFGTARWHRYNEKGLFDILLLRFDASGNLLWGKSYGGSGVDKGQALLELDNGDLLIGASSTSIDKQVTGNRGAEDAWIIRANSQGEIIWQKNFGGSGSDRIRDIVASTDGNLIGVGGTSSSDGHLQSNKGNLDAWIIKFDHAGNLSWSKNYGGSGDEEMTNAKRVFDKGFLLSGFTSSADGDVSENLGGIDSWTMLIGTDGHLEWQKNIGTSFNDYAKGSEVLSETSFVHAVTEEVEISSSITLDAGLIVTGNSNRIKGFIFHDANKNGSFDSGEKPFDLATVHIASVEDTLITFPRNGRFVIYTGPGEITTSLEFPDNRFAAAGPFVSNFTNYFNTDSFSVAVRVDAVLSDLSVSIVPITPARPGFLSKYRMSVTNNGSADVLNVRLFLKPDPHMSDFEFSELRDEIRSDTSFWDLANIGIGESRVIDISSQLDLPPQLNFGDTLVITAGLVGNLFDIVPSDNKMVLTQIVVGSYDPNDKAENHGGQISPAEITDGQFLTYVVRFQNTGTDTAFTVRIVDSISSAHVLSSLQMIAASHDYQLTQNGNRLEWRFDNINLVDSNRNEPASHGFVAFRIRPATNLQEGDLISNHASIYFDYNLPVITNLVQTEVTADHILPITLQFFRASKKGNHVDLIWQTSYEQNVLKFVVEKSRDGRNFTVLNEVLAKGVSTGAQYKVIDSQPINGKNFYRIKSIDIDGLISYSNIELVEFKPLTSGIIISPNPVAGDLRVRNVEGQFEAVRFTLFTISGTQVVAGLINLPVGTTRLPVNLKNLPKGIYVLSLKNAGLTWSQRFVLE